MALDPVVNGVTKFNAAHMNSRLQALWTQFTNIGNGVVALLAPAISTFTNAQHNHSNAANGGKITLVAVDASAYSDGEYTAKVLAGVLTLQVPTGSGGYPIGNPFHWAFSLAELEADMGGSWLACDGKTIGNAASGGTARANADCETLFTRMWNKFNGTSDIAIQDSSGSPVGWGVNAAADWAAGRRIGLFDTRGRVFTGRDNQGGTSANRITDAAADRVAGTGGGETYALSSGENGPHTHNLEYTGGPTDVSTTHNTAGSTGSSLALGGGTSFSRVRAASAGSGTPHSIKQPYFTIDYYVRYK